MQNNVTEITQKLLGALDGDYNVTNMAAIIEVITILEKITITKEMLETTRLGKHINELRKHLSNDMMARRVKGLVKKWRTMLLVTNPPEAVSSPVTTNGQIRASAAPLDEGGGGKKRPSSRLDAPTHTKKHRANGGGPAPPFEYDFSDNSNSSFKDIVVSTPVKPTLVAVNSDSNSSTSQQDAHRDLIYEDQQPKKRGRKKGSKNHKNLIEEAESSFSNKMAVSRGNAKVKTTQELIESLQQGRTLPATGASPTSPARNVEDWRERAAKLTERVSAIDQKLNSGGNRLKKHRSASNNNKEGLILTPPLQHHLRSTTPQSASRPDTPADDDDDEIIVVDDMPPIGKLKLRSPFGIVSEDAMDGQPPFVPVGPVSLSEEEALSRLPPIHSCEDDESEIDETSSCWCVLEEPAEPLVAVGNTDEAPPVPPPPAFREHADCPARRCLEEKYRLNDVRDERVALLHATCVDNLNGNYGEARLQCEMPALANAPPAPPSSDSCPDVNIVPNFYQLPAKSKACSETYKKYSISEDGEDRGPGPGADQEFREFHQFLDRPSYDGETLRILPYVIID